MSTWFTCQSCQKSFEYRNEGAAAELKKQLGDQPFVCLRCDDTIPPLSQPEAVHPDTGEAVRETHRHRVPTPDVVLTGASPALIRRLRERSKLDENKSAK